MNKKEKGFSGSIGFVLAAAGSAVGVGNIWRFPYLCAKDGGGLFLLIYLILVLTFGFVLRTKNQEKCPQRLRSPSSQVEIFRLSDFPGSYLNYDLLFRHRRLDLKIHRRLPGF